MEHSKNRYTELLTKQNQKVGVIVGKKHMISTPGIIDSDVTYLWLSRFRNWGSCAKHNHSKPEILFFFEGFCCEIQILKIGIRQENHGKEK